MQEFNAFCELIKDETIMSIFQYFLSELLKGVPDGVMEVSFHELEDKIEIFIVLCPENMMEFYHVGMR